MLARGFRLAVFAAALLSPLLLTVPALAEEILHVNSGETVYMAGTVHYKSITIDDGGILVVRSLDGATSSAGSLTIKAGSVTVQKGGLIDARGAGFPGTTAAGGAPACCSTAAGSAGPMDVKSTPGGGGASGGDGAAGCPNGGAGGVRYDAPMNGNPGSAGGASFLSNGSSDDPNRGGRGGGVVVIRAATVTVDGMILADGAPGISYGGVGTGGGAGGFIAIDASELLGTGLLSAKGGAGGEGYSGSGGGGGGGVIQISVGKALINGMPLWDISGGSTGTGTGTGTETCADGMPGIAPDVEPKPQNACIDADEDGAQSSDCGGNDCDDSDETVRGGDGEAALEVCDGKDNNCNGEVDDALVKDACGAGESCVEGECVLLSGSGSGPPSPDYLDYRGACDVCAARVANGAAFFVAAALGALAGLRARRKRAQP
jgi:hypothetical protein